MSTPQIPLYDQLRGFSRALFSTWIYHRRFNILFDAGEGVATALFNRVFGIRRIFLSHGHADHIAGLVNLLNIRNLGAGDQTACLKIYFPKNNRLIDLIREYLAKTQNDLSFPLEWIPVEPGDEIQLDDQKGRIFIRAFKTRHSNRQLSLGYNVVEIRRKLKEKYRGYTQKEINSVIWEKGKDEVAEDIEKLIFSYGGDSRPINVDDVKESYFLCHECTYLNVEDDERNFQQHSYLDEVLQMAKEAKVENLLLFHISLRYNLDMLREQIKSGLERMKPDCRVLVLYGDNMVDPLGNDSNRGKNRRNRERDSLEVS
ncbi:MAG: ribonuclease Z [Candidatus Rifleibacteriota bacterium]